MDEKQKHIIEGLQENLEYERKMQRRMIIFGNVFTILALLCLLIDNLVFAILTALPAVVIWYFVYLCRGSVERAANDLHMAQTDIEKFEWKTHIRSIDAQAQMRQNQAIYDAQHPQCPMCGSQNTQRISTLSRTASVAAVGLHHPK